MGERPFMFKKNLFKKKYRIKSIRLSYWDYSQPGSYFITICTKNRKEYFGYINNEIMCLNKYGNITYQEIHKTQIIRKNVTIDEFVVMPNHIHILLEINNALSIRRDEATPRLYVGKYPNMSKISSKSNSLSSIIGSLKSIITKRIHQNGLINFQWQSRFYEHIIRDEEDFYRIKEYIRNNPLFWYKNRNNLNKL